MSTEVITALKKVVISPSNINNYKQYVIDDITKNKGTCIPSIGYISNIFNVKILASKGFIDSIGNICMKVEYKCEIIIIKSGQIIKDKITMIIPDGVMIEKKGYQVLIPLSCLKGSGYKFNKGVLENEKRKIEVGNDIEFQISLTQFKPTSIYGIGKEI